MAKSEGTPKGPSAKDIAKEVAKLQGKGSKGDKEIKVATDTMKDTVDQSVAYLKNLRAIVATQAELNGFAQAHTDLTKEAQAAIHEARKAGKSLTKEEREIFAVRKKVLKLQEDQAKVLQKELHDQKAIHKLNEQFKDQLEDRAKAQKKLNALEDKYSESVGKGLEFIDDIDDKIKSIPIVGDFMSKALGLDKMKEELTDKFTGYITKAMDPAAAKQKEAADEALKGYDSQVKALSGIEEAAGGVTEGMGATAKGAGGIGKGLFSSIPGALGLSAAMGPILIVALAIGAAIALFKHALELDQEITDMARGLGTSRDEAEHIHHELIDIAATTKVVGANSKELSTAYLDIAKSMGVTKLANAEMAETQVLLTKQMGMSSESAVAFQKMSMAGGKSAEQNLAVIKAGVDSMTGGLMSYKEVAGEIAKSSKAVQASYKGNIAALTKAVVTAKKFGMTLDATKKSADGLLDIETSIEAEMTANVLTGKNMNLNKARELALSGDSAAALEETMKQVGGLNELQDMNIMQRKAMADTLNMSVDEMMAAAEAQENLNSIAKDVGVALGENGKYTNEQLKAAEALGNKEAKKLLQQEQINSAQEKMAAMGDKLMAIFTKLADPIMKLLNPILDLVDPLMEIVDFIMPAINAAFNFAMQPIKAIMGALGGIVKIFKGDFLGGIHDIGAAILGTIMKPFTLVYDLLVGFFPSIGKLVDKAMGWITDKLKSLLPDWALKLLGMGDDKAKEATPTGETVTEKAHDALIDPNGGLVVKGPKGSVQLDKEDSILAGTDLGKSSESSDEGGGILSGLASAIAAPLSAVGSMLGGKSDNSELASLLKELIAKVDQPVQFNIGGRVLDEIEKSSTVRRSYTSKVDRGYGATG